jgi:hypothetical protein
MLPDADDPSRRPRDLALLLLAAGEDSPRQRARDQQADRAGAALRRRVLDRLAALDPEPQGCAAALTRIVAEIGEPSGPTRGVCGLILREWESSRLSPGYWGWLLAEALGAGAEAGDRDRKRKGPGHAP